MPTSHRDRTRRKFAALAATVLAVTAGIALVNLRNTHTANAAESNTVGPPNVQDSFARTLSTGLGTAPTGGLWTVGKPSSTAVQGGFAVLGPVGLNQQAVATLTAVQTVDQTVTMSFKLTALPKTNQGLLVILSTRVQSNGDAVSARLKVSAGGALDLDLIRVNGGTTYSVSDRSHPTKITAGELYSLQIQTYGTAPVKASARAWPTKSTAPSWQSNTTITDKSVVTAAGGVGFSVYNANQAAATVRVNAILGYRMTPVKPASSSSAPSVPPTTSVAPSAPAKTSSAPAKSTTPAPVTSKPVPSTSASSSTASRTPTPTTAPPPSSPPSTIPTQPQFPDASTTGVPAGTKLKTVTGDQTITTAGTVLDGIDLHGNITIKAPNVTIRNSIIRGGQPTSTSCLIMAKTPTATNLQITNVEIVPEHPSVYQGAGICGGNFTATRVNVHGSVDGIKIHGDNVTIQDSYLHDEAWYSSDPGQDGGATHCDGVQILGGTNLHLIGNNIMGGRNSALQVTQDTAAVSNLHVEGNLLDYGTYPVHLNNEPLASMSGIYIDNNEFGSHQTGSTWAIVATSHVSFEQSGNVWQSSGQPAKSAITG